MSKSTRLLRTAHVTRATRETYLREANAVRKKLPDVDSIHWHRLFSALRQRMSKQFGLARMPRSVWRRR